MKNKTFCYSGRNSSTGKLLFCGTQHAESWEEAAEKVSSSYALKLRAGGFGADWVDKEGKRISLYLSVLPDLTTHGKAKMIQAQKEDEEARRRQEEVEEVQANELEQLIQNAGGVAEVIKKLRNPA